MVDKNSGHFQKKEGNFLTSFFFYTKVSSFMVQIFFVLLVSIWLLNIVKNYFRVSSILFINLIVLMLSVVGVITYFFIKNLIKQIKAHNLSSVTKKQKVEKIIHNLKKTRKIVNK